MSRSLDKCIDNIVGAFKGNIAADSDSRYFSLDSMGEMQLRSALEQLVYEIKEEIRNEANQ